MSAGGKGVGGGAGGLGGGAEPAGLRRLADEPPGDPLTSRGWAVGLLRRASPHRAPVGRKQRVRLALGQGGRRRTLPLLRPAIAGVVLIACGAAASAALGRWPEIVQAYRRLLDPAAAPAAVADARARRASSGQRARLGSRSAEGAPAAVAPASIETAPETAPIGGPALAPETAPAPSPSPSRTQSPPRGPAPGAASRASLRGSSASWRPRRVSVAAPISRRTPALSSPRAYATEDTTPVLEAIRALRVEANPARARRLLAGYLERYPSGSLAEEALAMSIEAAVAHGDDDVAMLARKYVRRYPSGHFSALARRTLDGPSGASR